jgi:hypothetical protein
LKRATLFLVFYDFEGYRGTMVLLILNKCCAVWTLKREPSGVMLKKRGNDESHVSKCSGC